MLFAQEAEIASKIYKEFKAQSTNNIEYGDFWQKYWQEDKEKFLNKELYCSFFDHERWNIKEFYDHNNPFDIKYSKGNYQAQMNLIKTLSALSQSILSNYFKNNLYLANNYLLRLFILLTQVFLVISRRPTVPFIL